MDENTPLDGIELQRLGLSPPAADVLAVLLDSQPTTAAELARDLQRDVATVSRALVALAELGLAEVGAGKPGPVVLGDVGPALDVLETRTEQRAVRELWELRRVAERVRGLPVTRLRTDSPHEVIPRGVTSWVRHLELSRCEDSYEVSVVQGRPEPFLPARAALGRLIGSGCRVRVLLSGGSGTPWRRATELPAGAQLRTLVPAAAPYTLVDRRRAELAVQVGGVTSRGWTHDRGEVAALGRLFDLLWDEADDVRRAEGATPG